MSTSPRKSSAKKAAKKSPTTVARKAVTKAATKALAKRTAKAAKSVLKTGARAPRSAEGARAPAARTAASKIVVRDSRIHGRGVYAARKLKKGEKIVEYRGEIISWKEADRRPPSDPKDPNHTFFFSLSDGKRVIDANVGGNDARWMNHSCAPNCETEETDEGRVFVEALQDIGRGEELVYDYCLIIDEKITKKLRRQYQCLCGAESCRGTMLALPKKKKRKKKD